VTVAVTAPPAEGVTVATTVTESDQEPMDVLPSAVVPEAKTCGVGVEGGVRSGPPPPPPPPDAPPAIASMDGMQTLITIAAN
jgi:hypothetical protein